MKHNWKITAVILLLFIITQFIGLFVVNHYSVQKNTIPYGMDTQLISQQQSSFSLLSSIIIAFVIAILLVFLLTRFKIDIIIRIWFFLVVIIALAISFNSVIDFFKYSALVAVLIAIPLAIIKIFQRNLIVHNLTELFIYPGVAAVFVPMLNQMTLIFLLILISIYDMWAVWKSGIMQKMAKYQIRNIKVFSGLFVPYIPKMGKARKLKGKNKKIKVNVAILGGGDIIFPIIAAGVMLKTAGFYSALLVIAGAVLGLSYLMFTGEKKKFYPAMPFISTGILIGMVLSWIFL